MFKINLKPPICGTASLFTIWESLRRFVFYRQRYKYRVSKYYEELRAG